MAHYHDLITFGRRGNGRELTTSGISFEEDAPYSWTLRSYADLEIKLPMARGNVSLTLIATPFTPGAAVPFQQVFFYWNGLFQYFLSEYAPLRLPTSAEPVVSVIIPVYNKFLRGGADDHRRAV